MRCLTTTNTYTTASARTVSGIGKVRNILEGESLLNDASSITLFIVLLDQVRTLYVQILCFHLRIVISGVH